MDSTESRYQVIDRKTGQEILGAFVLLPEHDSAARTALAAYGEATRNPKVARFVRTALKQIHDKRAQKKEYIS